jgi:hypothetical protein
MNFLAHLLLSGENEEIITGNYVGDFVKGRLTGNKISGWSTDFLLKLKEWQRKFWGKQQVLLSIFILIIF